MKNDFALLKLDRIVEPSPTTQFACLPKNVSSSYPKPNTDAFIVGKIVNLDTYLLKSFL
jgi:hypothetical protein